MPIRTKMEPLKYEDYKRILSGTQGSLLDQNVELLKVEDVNIAFAQDAIDEMAKICVELNEEDNTGARRLRTVLDAIMEQLNFEASDLENKGVTYLITKEYVQEKTKDLYQNRDFRKYTL